jgi:hypothetical protein
VRKITGEVERRAGELIPPRDAYEAGKLADLGPIVLELLPGPEDVDDEEAAGYVVLTACLIGGDSALPCLARYREHNSALVRGCLGSHWDKFDTETYANEIIQHLLVTPDTTVAVRSPEELRALSRLGGHSHVAPHGDFSRAQIIVAQGEQQLEHLALRSNSVVTDLAFLHTP